MWQRGSSYKTWPSCSYYRRVRRRGDSEWRWLQAAPNRLRPVYPLLLPWRDRLHRQARQPRLPSVRVRHVLGPEELPVRTLIHRRLHARYPLLVHCTLANNVIWNISYSSYNSKRHMSGSTRRDAVSVLSLEAEVGRLVSGLIKADNAW